MKFYLAASTNAVLITFNGSIIPALTISIYSPNYEAGEKCVSRISKLQHNLISYDRKANTTREKENNH